MSILAALPVVVFSAWLAWDYKSFYQQTLFEELKVYTAEAIKVVEEQFEVHVNMLTVLAESEPARKLDVPALYAYAQRVVRLMGGVHSISLVDRDGVLFSTSAPLGDSRVPAQASAGIERALTERLPNVSEIFETVVGDTIKVIAITVPIISADGAARHALRAIIPLDSFRQYFVGHPTPAGWIVSLADQQGNIVTRNIDPDRYVGRQVHASVLNALRSGVKDIFRSTRLDGGRFFTALQSLEEHGFMRGFFVYTTVSEDLFTEPLDKVLWSFAAFGVLWLALSALLAGVVSQYLVRQLQRVADTVSYNQWDNDALDETLRIKELHGMIQQVRQVKRSEVSLRNDLGLTQSQRNAYQDLYDQAPCGYHSLDTSGRVLRMNQTELSWLGLDLHEVLGRPDTDFLSQSSLQSFHNGFQTFLREGVMRDIEADLVRADGSTFPVLVNATAIRDETGAIMATRTSVLDNTAPKMLQAKLQIMARFDPLTGLSNRRDFFELAEEEISRSKRSGKVFSVLMLDVDHFKQVNDQYGHANGDRVLQQLAASLKEILRDIDKPARLGGEEFVVLMPETTLDEARYAAERVLEHIEGVIVAIDDDQTIRFTASIGLAQWNPDEDYIDPALKRADDALYQAKSNGRNRVWG